MDAWYNRLLGALFAATVVYAGLAICAVPQPNICHSHHRKAASDSRLTTIAARLSIALDVSHTITANNRVMSIKKRAPYTIVLAILILPEDPVTPPLWIQLAGLLIGS